MVAAALDSSSNAVLELDVGERKGSETTKKKHNAEEVDPLLGDVSLVGAEHEHEHDEESLHPATKSPSLATATAFLPWFLIKEETLGFLCNLASSLYNYHNSHKTWPHWEDRFVAVDRALGLPGGDGRYLDVSNEKLYTLGLPNVQVPLFVPRAMGTTTGCHLFVVLWAFIPVLYVSYFIAMYLLAPRSPWPKAQRALLAFGIFHFLFMTGKQHATVHFVVRNFLQHSCSLIVPKNRVILEQTLFRTSTAVVFGRLAWNCFTGLSAGRGALRRFSRSTKIAPPVTGSTGTPAGLHWERSFTTSWRPGEWHSLFCKCCAATWCGLCSF